MSVTCNQHMEGKASHRRNLWHGENLSWLCYSHCSGLTRNHCPHTRTSYVRTVDVLLTWGSLNTLLSRMKDSWSLLEQQCHTTRYEAQGTRQTRSHTDTTPYRPLFRYVTHGQLVKIGWLLVMVVASPNLYSSMSMSVLHNILAGTTCTIIR